MGCISSKLIPRSMSLKIYQREEAPNIPQKTNDQLVALVYTALENPDKTSIEELLSRSFHTVQEYDALTKNSELQVIRDDETITCVRVQDNYSASSVSLESAEQIVDNPQEKGLKRKSIAKRLYSLEIPGTVDYSAVASLKDWLHSQSQTLRDSLSDNEHPIFNPELVAAFEQPMQQLQVEAENFLKQISHNLEDEETNHN